MSARGSDVAPSGAWPLAYGTWMNPARTPGAAAVSWRAVNITWLHTNVPAEWERDAGIPAAAIAAVIAFTGRVAKYAAGAPATTGWSRG